MERDQYWSDRDQRAWLEFVPACLNECLPTSFPVTLLHLWFCWSGLVRNEKTSITKSQRSRAGIPSMRKPASREITSASVEQCETEVWFLAHPTSWHKCWASENAQNFT